MIFAGQSRGMWDGWQVCYGIVHRISNASVYTVLDHSRNSHHFKCRVYIKLMCKFLWLSYNGELSKSLGPKVFLVFVIGIGTLGREM